MDSVIKDGGSALNGTAVINKVLNSSYESKQIENANAKANGNVFDGNLRHCGLCDAH